MKFEENWLRGFRGGHTKEWMDGRTMDGLIHSNEWREGRMTDGK